MFPARFVAWSRAPLVTPQKAANDSLSAMTIDEVLGWFANHELALQGLAALATFLVIGAGLMKGLWRVVWSVAQVVLVMVLLPLVLLWRLVMRPFRD